MSVTLQSFSQLSQRRGGQCEKAVVGEAAQKPQCFVFVSFCDQSGQPIAEGIDEAAYWHVRQLLEESHYTHVEVEGDYVALIEWSVLDNISGVVLARNGSAAPAVGARFLGGDVTRVSALGDGWYRFSTT